MILRGWSRDVRKHYVIGCACYIDARGFSVSDAFKPITVTDLATFTKKIVDVDAAPGYLLSSTALLNLACLFFHFILFEFLELQEHAAIYGSAVFH